LYMVFPVIKVGMHYEERRGTSRVGLSLTVLL
jgi:hypothetical protein